MYGDGALGSRGACMHKPYSDKQFGALITPDMKTVANRIAASFSAEYTHIGDSANTVILKVYKSFGRKKRQTLEN
jgi:predicted amidohydrolase YtcJ